MKGNKKLLVAAILLLLIVVSYGTYAIYRETAEGEATISTAKWSVKVGESDFKDVVLDFDLTDTTNVHCTSNPGKNGTIAPGAVCYRDFAIDADGSEVDVVISVDNDNMTVPEPLTVTVGTTDGVEGPVTIPYSAEAGGMEKTIRLTVKWPGAESDLESKDTTDLDLSDEDLQFDIKLVARQSLS